MKIKLLKGEREADEPYIVSLERILLGSSFIIMIGLGFVYQQISNTAGANDQQLEVILQTESEMPTEEKTTPEPDEKAEIIKAIISCRSSLDAKEVASFADIIREESKKYNYDWELILAIIKTESHFNARARSHKGARGLMQVLPSTAKWLSPKAGLKYKGYDSLYDPEYNIKIGTHYLHMLQQRYGNIEKAIAAYNRGPTGLKRYLHQGKEFPPKYLSKVMSYYKELKNSSDEITS